jgi:uncharacterized membrane protein YesL
MLKFFDHIFKFVFLVFSLSTLWIIALVCGLFVFSFIPATSAVLELSEQYVKGKFNYTESIIKNYFVLFISKFKSSFKYSFLSLLLVIFTINIYIVKVYSIIGFQLLFIIIYYYLLIFFVTYLVYFCMYLNHLKTNLKSDILNGIVFMFCNFKRVAVTMLLIAIYLFIFYNFTLLALIFGTGIFGYLFAQINLKQLEKLLDLKPSTNE